MCSFSHSVGELVVRAALSELPVIYIGNGRGSAQKCAGVEKKCTILHHHTKPAKRRETDTKKNLGVRLPTRSEMMGNYISNYQREQERTLRLQEAQRNALKELKSVSNRSLLEDSEV